MRRFVFTVATATLLLGAGACTDTLNSPVGLEEEIGGPAAVRAASPHPLGEALDPGEIVWVDFTVSVPFFIPPNSSLSVQACGVYDWIQSTDPESPVIVAGGQTIDFTVALGPPADAVDGIYEVDICALVGGSSIGSLTVTIVVDQTAPIITLLGSDPVVLSVGDDYDDAGATALDNIDGDISTSIVTVNPVDTNVPGTYTVTYNVSDAAGNAADEVTRTVVVEESATLEVSIDIKPGSDPNSINLSSKGKGNGEVAGPNAKIAVALFSSEDFDATQVDVSTVRLGDDLEPEDTPVVWLRSDSYQASAEDVNGDGLMDMIFHFSRAALIENGDLIEGTEVLYLTGLCDGQDFIGQDDVRVIN